MKFNLLGVGSPLVDLSVPVSDEFLAAHVCGAKGGTLNITDAERAELLQLCHAGHLTVAGGAAANTIMAAAELGINAALLGKTGDDENGRIFRQAMVESGALTTGLFIDTTAQTGYCLAMVTPDAERTMRSNLGASLNITPADAEMFDFSPYDWVLIEGYFIGTDFFDTVLTQARAAGCKIALDLCSFELAAKYRDKFIRTIENYVSLLFANYEEAAALINTDDMDYLLTELHKFPGITALKSGKDGSILVYDGKTVTIPAAPAENVLDTTAAGDYYAAGFFYGLSMGLTPEKCARAGSVTAAEIICHHGTKLNKNIWNKLKISMEKI